MLRGSVAPRASALPAGGRKSSRRGNKAVSPAERSETRERQAQRTTAWGARDSAAAAAAAVVLEPRVERVHDGTVSLSTPQRTAPGTSLAHAPKALSSEALRLDVAWGRGERAGVPVDVEEPGASDVDAHAVVPAAAAPNASVALASSDMGRLLAGPVAAALQPLSSTALALAVVGPAAGSVAVSVSSSLSTPSPSPLVAPPAGSSSAFTSTSLFIVVVAVTCFSEAPAAVAAPAPAAAAAAASSKCARAPSPLPRMQSSLRYA